VAKFDALQPEIMKLRDRLRSLGIEAEPAAQAPVAPARRESPPTEEDERRAEAARQRLDDLSAQILALEAEASTRLTWEFEKEKDQFKHDTLATLVGDLERFVDADPLKGTVADVERRQMFAETVEKRTITERRADWDHAARSIAEPSESPEYAAVPPPETADRAHPHREGPAVTPLGIHAFADHCA
jgi:hypothetical protein